mmetsp:Transcript_173/g.459  ORF Transcript_173/g.459 Transcript_173/m.459 type:complete len:107 (-) Transcript_173:45-365(-)
MIWIVLDAVLCVLTNTRGRGLGCIAGEADALGAMAFTTTEEEPGSWPATDPSARPASSAMPRECGMAVHLTGRRRGDGRVVVAERDYSSEVGVRRGVEQRVVDGDE